MIIDRKRRLFRTHERKYMRNQRDMLCSFGATRLMVHGDEISASAKLYSESPEEMFLADAKEKDAEALRGVTYKDVEFIV